MIQGILMVSGDSEDDGGLPVVGTDPQSQLRVKKKQYQSTSESPVSVIVWRKSLL